MKIDLQLSQRQEFYSFSGKNVIWESYQYEEDAKAVGKNMHEKGFKNPENFFRILGAFCQTRLLYLLCLMKFLIVFQEMVQ